MLKKFFACFWIKEKEEIERGRKENESNKKLERIGGIFSQMD